MICKVSRVETLIILMSQLLKTLKKRKIVGHLVKVDTIRWRLKKLRILHQVGLMKRMMTKIMINRRKEVNRMSKRNRKKMHQTVSMMRTSIRRMKKNMRKIKKKELLMKKMKYSNKKEKIMKFQRKILKSLNNFIILLAEKIRHLLK